MTKAELKVVLDRVLTWPSRRQEDAAEMLALMEREDASEYRLSEEQADEIRRRLANSSAQGIPAAEVFRKIRSSAK